MYGDLCRLSSDAGDSGVELFSRSPPLVVTSIPYHRGYEFWGRLVWEEAVNLKLSFQDPFSCFLALYSGDAHGVSQRRFYLGLSFRC